MRDEKLLKICSLVLSAANGGTLKKAVLSKITGVTLGSDAFFPFSDNIERAKKSGVSYVVQPGGSVRDDLVIKACDERDMVMSFTGMRLFHH